MLAKVLEAHISPSVVGLFSLFGLPAYDLLVGNTDAVRWIRWLAAASAFPMVWMQYKFHFLHMRIDAEFLRHCTRKWVHFFDIAIFPISAIFYMTLPSCLSNLDVLFSTKEAPYIVAEKCIDDE